MQFARFVLAAALGSVIAVAAEVPLPGLRIEPTNEASILYVRNGYSQPLTAFLIELAGYPGSYYQLWEEGAAEPVAPGAEKRIAVSDMTVGAVPDYVKVRAAIYADGTSGGDPEEVKQLLERRKFLLNTAQELIARLEKGKSGDKAALANELKQWAEPMQKLSKSNHKAQNAINEAAAKKLILDTAADLEGHSADEVLANTKAYAQALAGSRSP